jgi:hypothetical protein
MDEKKSWPKVAYSKTPYYVCISKGIQSPLRKTRTKRTEGSFARKADMISYPIPLETPSQLFYPNEPQVRSPEGQMFNPY